MKTRGHALGSATTAAAWRRAAALGAVVLAVSGRMRAATVPEDPALRAGIETSCRTFLDFYAGLQVNGGWAVLYHHPTLWPFSGGERHGLKSWRTVDFAKGGLTARTVMNCFLPAYETLGDKRYLDVACRSCDVLVKGQSANGQLQAHYFVHPDGRVDAARAADAIEMPEDEGPALAIMMLVWTARLSGAERYQAAASRCARLYIRAQNPNGSWAQKFNLRTGRTEGLGYAVLNDGATSVPMRILLLMYHVTQDPEFLAPIVRAADWLVRVQNRQGGIPGWAEQYDEQDRPCWARPFEPPAVCTVSTAAAWSALDMAYRLTHDDQYLEPLRTLIAWLRQHERREWGFYTDPTTAEAICGHQYQVHKGEAAQVGDLRRANYVRTTTWPIYQPEELERRLRELVLGAQPADVPDLDRLKADWRLGFWQQAQAFAGDIERQNAQGYWPGQSTWKDRAMQCASTVTYDPAVRMLKSLHLLAAAEGRVPPHAVGTRHWHLRAWPVPDVYDTPLRGQRP